MGAQRTTIPWTIPEPRSNEYVTHQNAPPARCNLTYLTWQVDANCPPNQVPVTSDAKSSNEEVQRNPPRRFGLPWRAAPVEWITWMAPLGPLQ